MRDIDTREREREVLNPCEFVELLCGLILSGRKVSTHPLQSASDRKTDVNTQMSTTKFKTV